MNIFSIISWVGNGFLISGLWGIGNRWRPAFLLSIIGETLWIISAANTGNWSLVFMCSIFGATALRSYLKWGKSAPAPKPMTEMEFIRLCANSNNQNNQQTKSS